jgi:hypothetical protein
VKICSLAKQQRTYKEARKIKKEMRTVKTLAAIAVVCYATVYLWKKRRLVLILKHPVSNYSHLFYPIDKQMIKMSLAPLKFELQKCNIIPEIQNIIVSYMIFQCPGFKPQIGKHRRSLYNICEGPGCQTELFSFHDLSIDLCDTYGCDIYIVNANIESNRKEMKSRLLFGESI